MPRLTNGAHSIDLEAPVTPYQAPSVARPSTASPEADGELHEVALELGDVTSGSSGDENPDLNNMESIPEHRRVFIEMRDLSAHVTALFGQPSLWQRLKPSAIKRRVTEGGSFRAPKQNQILFDVSGCVKPGEVLALMGPSGSGKTTLLSIMGGRGQRRMTVTGETLFNGKVLDKSVKRRIGFVNQDDLLYEALTVYETLYYAAMLRLPRDMSKQDKLRRVNAVITSLGLDKCKDTIVGGFFRRGISGGERKRTSVGHELLINPSTLFLDEPTSGLDSTTAMHLLETLRKLAHGGRAVVTTIHQPSSRLYQQLDKLLLLSGGHVLYYGSADQAVDYCDCIGYPIPPRVNAADFLLDLASGEVSSKMRDGEHSRRHLIAITEAFLSERPLEGFDANADPDAMDAVKALAAEGSSPELHTRALKANRPVVFSTKSWKGMDPPNSLGDSAGSTPGAAAVAALGGRVGSGEYSRPAPMELDISAEVNARSGARGRYSVFKGSKSKSAASLGGEGGDKEHRWGAPYWVQVGLLFQRSLRTRRFQTLSIQDFSQFLIIAVISGLFWLQAGKDQTLRGARDVLGVLFFMLMFLSFRSLFVSLFTFPDEQRHMLKERASGLYRLSAFYLARLLSDFPMDLSIPTGFIIIVYFMAGLRYSAAAFFGIYGTLLLSMFVAQSLGLLLGSWLMNPKTAQTVAAVLMLTIVLTGGFFVQNIPSWIGWLKWLSYIYYALGILLYVQYDGGNAVLYSCTAIDAQAQCVQTAPANPQTDPSCIPVDDLKASLGLLQDPSSQGAAIRNGFVLLGFLIVLRVAVYYVLRRKTAGL